MRIIGFKKLFVALMVAGGVLFVGNGCVSDDAERVKLAGCDVDVFKIYAEEIAVLKNKKIPSNSKVKLEAIETLLDNVDFDQIYTPKQMEALLGRSTLAVKGLYGGIGRRYRYSYRNKAILIDYWFNGSAVLKVRIQEE